MGPFTSASCLGVPMHDASHALWPPLQANASGSRGLELTILELAATRMSSLERPSSKDLYILDQRDVACRTLESNTNYSAYRNNPGHGVNCRTHSGSGPYVCEHAGLLPPHLESQCALQVGLQTAFFRHRSRGFWERMIGCQVLMLDAVTLSMTFEMYNPSRQALEVRSPGVDRVDG